MIKKADLPTLTAMGGCIILYWVGAEIRELIYISFTCQFTLYDHQIKVSACIISELHKQSITHEYGFFFCGYHEYGLTITYPFFLQFVSPMSQVMYKFKIAFTFKSLSNDYYFEY